MDYYKGKCGQMHSVVEGCWDCDTIAEKEREMKDDSLADTQVSEYCPKCDRHHNFRIDCSVGKQPDPLLAKHQTALNVYEKEVWNQAIEAAAKAASENGEGCCWNVAEEIRKLKK